MYTKAPFLQGLEFVNFSSKNSVYQIFLKTNWPKSISISCLGKAYCFKRIHSPPLQNSNGYAENYLLRKYQKAIHFHQMAVEKQR